MDRYAQLYMSQWAMVMAVAAVMEGEAADWVTDLYNEHGRELGDIGLFLVALREQFEDTTMAQRAEGELLAARQRGRPVADYIREFRRLSGKLRGWPELLFDVPF